MAKKNWRFRKGFHDRWANKKKTNKQVNSYERLKGYIYHKELRYLYVNLT